MASNMLKTWVGSVTVAMIGWDSVELSIRIARFRLLVVNCSCCIWIKFYESYEYKKCRIARLYELWEL